MRVMNTNGGTFLVLRFRAARMMRLLLEREHGRQIHALPTQLAAICHVVVGGAASLRLQEIVAIVLTH